VVDPGVSARSSTLPRRRCDLAASTCDGTGLDDDGVVERLVATNDSDAGAPHVLHSRRGGCLVSSATTVQLRFTATTVDCRRRTTSRMTAGRRKWSRLLVTRLQSARHVDRIIVMTSALVDFPFKTAPETRGFRNATIKTTACACETVRPAYTQR